MSDAAAAALFTFLLPFLMAKIDGRCGGGGGAVLTTVLTGKYDINI